MILDEIVAKRKEQLTREKERIAPEEMQARARAVTAPTKDFRKALARDGLSVIAEVKKASPSKGVICENFCPREIAHAYENAGADAISVLTEEHYFRGGSQVLQEVRKSVAIPILRKDFIIDEYQIYEARAIGADAILLIAAILDTQTLEHFLNLAHSLNLDCLTEIHNMDELESAVAAGADIIGINNRNLKTFEVNLGTTRILAENIPDEAILVSESGLRTDMDLLMVRKFGADAVLIGESFMRKVDGAKNLHTVISEEMQALRGAVK